MTSKMAASARAGRASQTTAAAHARPQRAVIRRKKRPANDNGAPAVQFLERTVKWLVPVAVFGLLAVTVASAG